MSPLSWFTDLTCTEVAERMQSFFTQEFRATESVLTGEEIEAAEGLVTTKYGQDSWISRLP